MHIQKTWAALVWLALASFNVQYSIAHAQGTTAFSYQGRLNDGTNAATGSYDLMFTLYDSNTLGNVVAGPLTNAATTVNNGLFTVPLDFGASAFTSSNVWLEISARTNGGDAFSVLTPRQQILATPFSLFAANASVAVSANFIATTNIGGTIADNQLSTNVPLLNGSATFAGGVSATNFSGSGAGLTNVPGALLWQVVSGTNQQAGANRGYLLTNNSLVTVTLPPSTNVNLGDVIRISSIGANGWRVGQNTGQVVKAVGSEFSSYTAWTNRGPFTTWGSIAASSDGTKFVAGGSAGIYTSTDSGATWTFRTNILGAYVASSFDGTKLVAASSSSDTIYTSSDSGATWTSQSAPFYSWRAVASSEDGTKLVAVPASGNIYTSPDSGVDWISRNPSLNWYSVASSSDGTKLAAVSSTGIYTSTNSGSSWIQRTNFNFSVPSGAGGPFIASSADGTKLAVAAGSGNTGPIYTSGDSGLTWVTPNSGMRYWSSIAASSDGTKLVATDNGNGARGFIYFSTDSGQTWLAQNSTNQVWGTIAMSGDATKIAAAVGINISGNIWTSQFLTKSTTTTGTNGFLLGGQNMAIELQYIGYGQFQPVSHEGNISAY